jgi:integrase
MRSFFIDRPVPDKPFPVWELTLVLDALRHSPFEPRGSIPLASLTYKTIFRIALASGKRRGELYALFAKGSGVSDKK